MTYASLLEMVKANQGRIVVNLEAVEVGREKKSNFPRFGFGFGWTKKMRGSYNGTFPVELETTARGQCQKRNILGMGYGFAWAKEMRGQIGDMEFDLTAIKVIKKKEKNILAAGYGFAWVEQMTGEIGNGIKLRFTTTSVGKEKNTGFPGFGYGYGWSDKAELAISID